MDFGSLIFNLQPEERSSIRTVEKISKKLITAEFAVIFNNIYIYMYFYMVIGSIF